VPVFCVIVPEECDVAFMSARGAGRQDIVPELKCCVFICPDFDFREDTKVKIQLVNRA